MVEVSNPKSKLYLYSEAQRERITATLLAGPIRKDLFNAVSLVLDGHQVPCRFSSSGEELGGTLIRIIPNFLSGGWRAMLDSNSTRENRNVHGVELTDLIDFNLDESIPPADIELNYGLNDRYIGLTQIDAHRKINQGETVRCTVLMMDPNRIIDGEKAPGYVVEGQITEISTDSSIVYTVQVEEGKPPILCPPSSILSFFIPMQE